MTFTLDPQGHLVKIREASFSGCKIQRKRAAHRTHGDNLTHHGKLMMF